MKTYLITGGAGFIGSTLTEKLLEQLEKPDLAGQLSFWNWLELLKKFLKKQYPDDYEEYEKLLQEMKIL